MWPNSARMPRMWRWSMHLRTDWCTGKPRISAWYRLCSRKRPPFLFLITLLTADMPISETTSIILLYGFEVCNLCKRDLYSLDFVVNRFFYEIISNEWHFCHCLLSRNVPVWPAQCYFKEACGKVWQCITWLTLNWHYIELLVKILCISWFIVSYYIMYASTYRWIKMNIYSQGPL